MTLSNTKRLGSVPVKCYCRGAQLYAVTIDAQSSPTIQHQDEAVISGVSRSSAGVYVLTLVPEFKRVYPAGAPNVAKAGDWKANVKTRTEGNATATVTVEVVNGAAAADPSADVDLLLYLVDAGGS